MYFFLLTTRGLEDVVEGELREAWPAVRMIERGYRRVLLELAPEALRALTGLRTADDVFVLVAEWDELGRERTTLGRVALLAEQVDLSEARRLCGRLRPLAQPVRFAVSASFVGRRNYSGPELKLAVAEGVAQRHGWAYLEHEQPDALSLRLFIEHKQALLGVRLTEQPLHRRAYRTRSIPGSLRPQVAAALLRLAGLVPGRHFLDPLCGAGTLVIEAALMGAYAHGGDLDEAALALAYANLADSGAHAELQHWDATRLPLPTASCDCAATNLPFGLQVDASDDPVRLYTGCLAELARVLRPGARAALLTSRGDDLAAALGAVPALELIERREISLHGQTPGVWVLYRQ